MREHGSYDLHLNSEKNTITFKAYESWNYETAIKWGAEIKSLVVSLHHQPWACLVDLTEWELATPDIGKYLYELYAWLNEQNLKHLAVVFGMSIHQIVLEKSYLVLSNVDKNFCQSIDEANDWLTSVGF